MDGVMMVSLNATVMRLVPEARAPTFMAFMQACNAAAIMLAPLIGSQFYSTMGFALPFVIVGIALLVGALLHCTLLHFAPRDVGRQEERPGADPRDLLLKPSIVASVLITVAFVVPSASAEPGVEPYLTAPPFNLSVDDVGLIFSLGGLSQVLGTLLAPLGAMAIGHLGSIYLAALVAFTAQLLNARAPQLLGIYISCSVVQSLTQGWMLVIASPLMMRVCRSYALEPK
eukprot:228294-Prymnesium_polylepis.1